MTEDGNPCIYFNTNVHSQKVKQLQADGRVNMTYLDPGTLTCITYYGDCERVPYPESAQNGHWMEVRV